VTSPERPLGRLPWLVFVALVLHVFEEWPRFPEWATLHFGTTSPRFYVLSHIPILGLVAWAAYRASRPAASASSLWWIATILSALGANVIFHVASSVGLSELSPGLLTALLLYAPLLVFLFPRLALILGRRRSATAVAAGVAISAVVTASLGLDMPR